MVAPTPQLPVERLRSYLQSDAPTREASAARFSSGVALALVPVVTLLGLVNGWQLSALLLAVIVPFGLFELGLLRLIRRGHYAPWMSWLNVLLETSIPCAVIAADLYKGPEYALTAPPLTFWGPLVMFSMLRASRSVAVAAGLVAALEYLGLYFFAIHPRLAAPIPVALQPPMIAVRAFLLFCSGVGAAVLAHQFLRKAEEALSAVRAQDLMSKYLLHERLGAGGMAEVFRATYCPEGGFQKIVAVKRVLASYSNDVRFTELFLFEAELCSRLHHPNIVQVTDVGRFDGQYVLAMEFVDGLPLNAVLRRRGRALPVAAVAYLGAELASALDYLHVRTDASGKRLGLVHRDVNPPNVLCSRIGEVKLSDFGVAHAANRQEDTPDGVVVGKLSYASPEQVRHEPLDGRADLFCLGLTLYEALTGVRPLQGATREDTLARVFQPIPPASTFRPDVPQELEALLAELLAQDREKRPASGREVRARLMALTGHAAPYPLGHEQLARAVEEARLAPDAYAHTVIGTAPDVVATESDGGQRTAGSA